jgi:hypothetical protein
VTPQQALRKLEALTITTDAPMEKVMEAEECLKVLWDLVLLGKTA